MPNAEKTAAVAEITEQFTTSSATVITEYRGLTVKQVTQLRRALGRDTTYAVVKNTLTKRAAADAGVEIDEALLTGPTAIAFVKGDPVEAAKGLRDFARTNPLLVIKGGVLDGKLLSAAEIGRIADLESREVAAGQAGRGDQGAADPRGRAVPGAAVADGPPGEGARGEEAAEPPAADAARRGTGRPSRGSAADVHDARRRRGTAEQPKLPPSRRSSNHPSAGSPGRTERTPSWRSSAPTSCSTPSRR